MSEFTSKPLSEITFDALTETATKAMRRAQRVAAKESARYGLTLVLERPRSSAKKK